MDEKQLRKCSRQRLIELLLECVKENEDLKLKLQQMQEREKEHELIAEQSGNMAKEALAVYQVLENAQKAADAWLASVKKQSAEPAQPAAKED